MLHSGPEFGQKEVACSSKSGGDITTGGGFSTLFPAANYQKKAIAGYFKSLNADEIPKGGYDSQGRAYPDLAFVGHNYEIVVGGKKYLVCFL